MNEYAQAAIDFALDQLGKPYVFGAKGPKDWDCRGLVRKSARAAGLDASIVPAANNVRDLAKWAQDNGRLRLASSGYVPQPGDVFLWGPADGSKPVKGAGHTGLVIEAPSAEFPNGWAVSAYDPARGVIEHRLIPKAKSGHALYGYLEPAYPVTVPEPPITDPETPPPGDAIDPPPTAAELQAKIDAAVEVLTK